MCEKHGFCSVKNRWAAGLLASLVLFAPGCGIILPKYTTAIERVAANDFERGLIAAAEAACADQEALAATCTKGTDATETCGWSCGETPYFKVPYAVTQEALSHYTDLIEDYQSLPFQFLGAPLTAELEYTANVFFQENHYDFELHQFVSVYRVTLQLSFVVSCRGSCVYDIDAERIVLFDLSGNLISVYGDAVRGYGIA